MKSVGTIAKIANGVAESASPAVKNSIEAASEASQTVIRNEIKEEIDNND